MLKQRIVTALVLVGMLLLAMTVGRPFGFPVFALAMVGIVIGEWLMLLRLSKQTSIVLACVTMLVLWVIDSTSIAFAVSIATSIVASLAWTVLAVVLFASGRFPPSDRWRSGYAWLALILPGACWFALVAAYRTGLVYLLSILAIAWAADIAAYFAGRAFGKRKLAPAISPGKTWAGAIGGALATLLFALILIAVPQLSDSFFAVIDRRGSLLAVLAVTLLLVVLSVVGDLFESHLKRQRGVKDSSRLLPGHGGVFDRVDAMLPVVPLALLIGLAA